MRVIAGEFGGRRLVTPSGRGTRPTSDRVREAWLMSLEPLAGRVVVDLYCGGGALGIEALSRGAREAHLVERDRAALAALRRNLEELEIGDRARIWPLELPRGLGRLATVLARTDVVFLDPPYGSPEASQVLAWLGEPGRLPTDARVGWEHHRRETPPEAVGVLARVRERSYGETVVSQYRVAANGIVSPAPEGA